ncbi:MAG: peroxiredoxin family protein [Fimbriimonadaceae bacterium]
MSKVGFYMPQRLQLASTQPTGLKNVPAGAARFGTFSFGGKSFATVEVEANGKPSALVIDFTGTNDFAAAKPFSWSARPLDPRKPTGLQLYSTSVMAPSRIGGDQPVSVSFYRFDPADTKRAQLKDMLLYYCNYALDGTATLGGTTYHAMVLDTMTRGDFDGDAGAGAGKLGSATLLIDRDGDGKFEPQYEAFDASKPFNIGGTTYQVTGLHGDGSSAALIKSQQTVAEIPVPPSLVAGKKVIAFTAVDRSGKTVHFPEDFKGKVVMLDFWATWCGPCMGEVPNVVSVYNREHSQGFDILGISLDNAQTIKQITPVTKQKGMTWDQVADGKFWDAAVAKLYGIQSIPAAYIVDGDTGMIYGEGDAIRGDNLLPAVQKALSSKNHKPK